MMQTIIFLLSLSIVAGFAPFSSMSMRARMGASLYRPRQQSTFTEFCMKLGEDEKIIVIGVAADSGCGKSTFMRRLTKVFGGANVGPLGGGFPQSWETNTLVSDRTTVLCLDDYHLNDRQGRKVSGLTALNTAEQKFDLMAEQLGALKAGKTIAKPIYNHVNGTIDAPETVTPTPIVIIEGLHPLVDDRVRSLLDFTIYLDISDEIKFAWKIQRDMAERGWTLEQVKADIEKRKPDFASYVAPQMQYSDIVISVLPSEISTQPVGTHLKVKLVQKIGKEGLPPAFILDPVSSVTVVPDKAVVKADPTSGLVLKSYKEKFFGHDVAVLEMDGKITDINDYLSIEKFISDSAAKTPTELSSELIKVGPNSPGSMDGTGLFQTITALKLRNYYEYATGKQIGA